MNESNEAMREAFETWAFNEGLDIGRSYMQLPTRCYISLNTNSAWRAWQAAQPQPQTVRGALEKAMACCSPWMEPLEIANKIQALIEPLSVTDSVAVQEPVYQVVTGGGGWIDTTEYFYNLHPGYKRMLYYSPTLDKESP